MVMADIEVRIIDNVTPIVERVTRELSPEALGRECYEKVASGEHYRAWDSLTNEEKAFIVAIAGFGFCAGARAIVDTALEARVVRP